MRLEESLDSRKTI